MGPFPVRESDKQKIIAIIKALIPDAHIYLFGSRARGTNSEWSDIDLALDAGYELPQLAVGEVRDVLASLNTPYRVDVLDLRSSTLTENMRLAIERDKVLWKS